MRSTSRDNNVLTLGVVALLVFIVVVIIIFVRGLNGIFVVVKSKIRFQWSGDVMIVF